MNNPVKNTSEETQNVNSKKYKHPYDHCCLIYSCQDMEAAQVPINRWVYKTTMGHLHNGILLGHKKEENFTSCNIMDRSGEHYAKWNKPVRERQIPYDFTHTWNLMNKLNKQNRLIDGDQMTAGGGRLGGGGIEQKGKRTHGHGQQCGDCGGGRGCKGAK